MYVVGLVVAAAAGGLLLQSVGLTGGLVIGSTLGAAAFSLARGSGEIAVPGWAQTAALVVIGAALGSGVTRDTVTSLRGYLLPAAAATLNAHRPLSRGPRAAPRSGARASRPGRRAVPAGRRCR